MRHKQKPKSQLWGGRWNKEVPVGDEDIAGHCPKQWRGGETNTLASHSLCPPFSQTAYSWPTAAWRYGRLRNMAEELAPPSTSNSPEQQKVEGWIWSIGHRTVTCRMWTFLEMLQKSGNTELIYFMEQFNYKANLFKISTLLTCLCSKSSITAWAYQFFRTKRLWRKKILYKC